MDQDQFLTDADFAQPEAQAPQEVLTDADFTPQSNPADQQDLSSHVQEEQRIVYLSDKDVTVGYPASMNDEQAQQMVKENFYEIPIKVPGYIQDQAGVSRRPESAESGQGMSGAEQIAYPINRALSQTIEKPAWAVTELVLKGLNGIYKFAGSIAEDLGLAQGIKTQEPGFLDKAVEHYSNPEKYGFFTEPAERGRVELREASYQRNYVLGIAGDVAESITDLMAFMIGASASGVSKVSEGAELAQTSMVQGFAESSAKLSTYGFLTTRGDLSDRAKSAVFLVGYGLTPYIANATGATGLNAVAVNSMLNTFLSTPSYAAAFKNADGVNREFIALIIPQFIMDVGFSWNVRGTPENQFKTRLDRYLKGRAKEMAVSEKEAALLIDKMRTTLNEPNSLKEDPATILQAETALDPFLKPQAEAEPKTPDVVKQLIEALKGAKDVRKKQEKLYSQERGKRLAKSLAAGRNTTGEKGFYAELGALKGELPKAEFEAIREKFTQENIDALFNLIKDSPVLSEFDRINARAGLAKMFGEFGGKVPTTGEIKLLTRVYGQEFTEAILQKRALITRAVEAVGQALNVPRSIMSSFDLSAPFRQGIFLIGRPKEFFGAFSKMFKAFGDQRAFNAVQESIISDPLFKMADDAGLALTDMGYLLGEREERFMSNWAEKIPVAGKGVKASGRAYVAFLNKLRFETFKDMVQKAENVGLDPKENPDLTASMANFINNATGRGSLGKAERAAIVLNSVLFSPRLVASRFNLINPFFYTSLDPFVRKEALKSLFSFVGTGLTVTSLAALAGATVGVDPRSADFGKIKIGNTRIDTWGGFQQLARLSAQLVTGQLVSSTTGRIMTLGEGYKPLTRLDIIQRYFESKESPIASFVTDMLRGETGMGEEFSISEEMKRRFIPMIIQDTMELANEDPALVPLAALVGFGFGVQTYGGKKTGGQAKLNMDF